MSARHRIPALATAVSAAVLLLAGCSSSGTVGANSGSSHGSSGGFTGGTGGDSGGFTGGDSSDSGGSSGGDLSGSSDPGCAAAMTAILNAEKLQGSSDPNAAISGLRTSISQLHSAAGKAKKPGAKDAITKVADDLQSLLATAQSGKNPDPTKALTDAETVGTICGG